MPSCKAGRGREALPKGRKGSGGPLGGTGRVANPPWMVGRGQNGRERMVTPPRGLRVQEALPEGREGSEGRRQGSRVLPRRL